MGLMALAAPAVTVGLYDRLELSYAWQGFHTRTDSWRGWRRCSIRW